MSRILCFDVYLIPYIIIIPADGKIIWAESEGPYFSLFELQGGRNAARLTGYPEIRPTKVFGTDPEGMIYVGQGPRLVRVRPGQKKETVLSETEPIEAINVLPSRVFYSTPTRLMMYTPRTGQSMQLRPTSRPVSTLHPYNIRK